MCDTESESEVEIYCDSDSDTEKIILEDTEEDDEEEGMGSTDGEDGSNLEPWSQEEIIPPTGLPGFRTANGADL